MKRNAFDVVRREKGIASVKGETKNGYGVGNVSDVDHIPNPKEINFWNICVLFTGTMNG
ncbi:MAG TPA: hypothetical protein ACFYEF_00345 [Candidatus Wunengus sp. YC63]|uniref:hypothetical protein n=1 Tax=unclassified Candidatus Wunengus TaxID=3367695 RepID=UPI00402A38B0